MKRILFVLFIVLVLILSGCSDMIYSKTQIKIANYDVYLYESRAASCEAYMETVYISELDTIYYLGYSGCGYRDAFYIKDGRNYILIEDAMDEELLSVEQVKEAVDSRGRNIQDYNSFSEGDYVFLDFYINQNPVYQKHLGICEAYIEVVYFEEDGIEYYIGSSGCDIDESILYTYIDDECIALKDEYDKGNVSKEDLKILLRQRPIS